MENKALLIIGLLAIVYLVTTYGYNLMLADKEDTIRHLRAENKELKKLLK